MIREIKYINSLGEEIVFGGESSQEASERNGEWHFGENDIFNVDLDYATTHIPATKVDCMLATHTWTAGYQLLKYRDTTTLITSRYITSR